MATPMTHMTDGSLTGRLIARRVEPLLPPSYYAHRQRLQRRKESVRRAARALHLRTGQVRGALRLITAILTGEMPRQPRHRKAAR